MQNKELTLEEFTLKATAALEESIRAWKRIVAGEYWNGCALCLFNSLIQMYVGRRVKLPCAYCPVMLEGCCGGVYDNWSEDRTVENAQKVLEYLQQTDIQVKSRELYKRYQEDRRQNYEN